MPHIDGSTEMAEINGWFVLRNKETTDERGHGVSREYYGRLCIVARGFV